MAKTYIALFTAMAFSMGRFGSANCWPRKLPDQLSHADFKDYLKALKIMKVQQQILAYHHWH